MPTFLEFEKPIAELEGKIEELRHLSDSGGMNIAEEVAKLQTKADRLLRMPDTMDFVSGSAFLLTYGTSYHALKDRAQLRRGETLLVLGASGGVGLAAIQIGKAMGGRLAVGLPRTGPYDVTQYQTTHNTGGTIMGDDPSRSVVNRYLQSWDVSNVFVIGASNYPQNASYNPTGTLGALAFWAADAIVTKYVKAPGPLISR